MAEVTKEKIQQCIEEFQDQSGAVMGWRLTNCGWGFGSDAEDALCQYIVDSLNGNPTEDFDEKFGREETDGI